MNPDLKDSSDSKGKKSVYFAYCLIAVAVGCCLTAVIVGCTGVFRGYSVQSLIPAFFPVVSLLACVGVNRISKIYPNRIPLSGFNNVVILFIICYHLFAGVQGLHYRKGLTLYHEGNYAEAAVAFEKETQLWYHKVTPDISEPSSMHYLAQSYCQLGDYDKARNVYELSLSRYQGTVHGDLAKVSLVSLESGLKAVSEDSDQNRNGHDEKDN